MLDTNGSMIRNDIIEAFNKATTNPENINTSGGINWDFVEADLFMDVGDFYSTDYLLLCAEVLVEKFFSK